MSVERAPAFQFYPRDFASDGRVEAMTTEEVGAYILILCKAWFEDPCGTIPDDDTILANWARVPRAKWRRIKAKVLAPFAVGPDGRLHQKRMQIVASEQAANRERMTNRARKGAEARWNNGAQGMLKHSSSNGQAMPVDASASASASASSTASALPDTSNSRVLSPFSGQSTSARANAPTDHSDEFERAISEAIMTVNRGMIDNPQLQHANPIPTGHGASRQVVADWLSEGIPIDTIKLVLYERAKSYRPTDTNRQIHTLKYFNSAVHTEWTAVQARGVEKPVGDLHGISRGFDAGCEAAAARDGEFDSRGEYTDLQNRRPDRSEFVSTNGNTLDDVTKKRAERDAERVQEWAAANPAEADLIRTEEERAVDKSPLYTAMGERAKAALVEANYRKRIMDRLSA